MSIDTSAIAAVFQSKSQDKATSANRKNARDTNATNVLLNLMMRGGAITERDARRYGLPKSVVGMSSAILPYYLNQTESQAGTYAADLYKAIQEYNGNPADQLQEYDRLLQQYNPAFDANRNLVIDIGSGTETQRMLDEAAPVAAARMDVAQQKKNAGLEALKQTLSEIDAIQARKGYTGDSFGNRLLKFNARRAIGTQGAADIAGANLENELEKQAIKGQGRSLRLSSLSLPDTLARAEFDRKTLPASGVNRNMQSALAPLSFFNIGPGAASQYQRFTEDASTSPWQILAQAAGTAGNTAANYLLQRNLRNNAQASAQNAYVNSFANNPSNWGTGNWTPPDAGYAGGGAAGGGVADIAPADFAPVSVAG